MNTVSSTPVGWSGMRERKPAWHVYLVLLHWLTSVRGTCLTAIFVF